MWSRCTVAPSPVWENAPPIKVADTHIAEHLPLLPSRQRRSCKYLDTTGCRRPPRSTISAQNGGQQHPSMVRAGNDPLKSLDPAGLSLTRLSAACLDCYVVGADIRLTGNPSILRATRADKPLEALEALESPFSSRCCGKERSRCADFLCPCGRHEARTVAGPLASGSPYWHRKCSSGKIAGKCGESTSVE